MNKKGAIELSMTTIIIIIIGVVILMLGIGFVTNVLTGAEDIAGTAITGGKEQVLGILGSSKDPVTLYSTNVDLEQGDYNYIGVVVLNDQGDSADYVLTTELKSRSDNNLDCYIAESLDLTDSFTLNSGLDTSRTIVIEDTGNSPLALNSCTITVTRNGVEISKESILINVVESGGFF